MLPEPWVTWFLPTQNSVVRKLTASTQNGRKGWAKKGGGRREKEKERRRKKGNREGGKEAERAEASYCSEEGLKASS